MADQPIQTELPPSAPQGDEIPTAAPQAEGVTPPTLPAGHVHVFDPEGNLGSIPQEQLDGAQELGYMPASPEDVHNYALQQKYGTAEQQLKTVGEGLGEGVAGPLFTAAETALGVKGEDIRGRSEANPIEKGVSQAGGLAASLATGVGEGALLSHAGEAGAAALVPGAEALFNAEKALQAANKAGKGIKEAQALVDASPALVKIGSAAARAAIETSVLQSGDEVSKMIEQDPNQTAETAVINVGLASILGGATGATFGAVSPLWKAAQGSKVGQALKSITERLGGAEGAELAPSVEKAIEDTGIDMPPEVKAHLSEDPQLQQMARTLEQSDTTRSGQAYQETLKSVKKQAGDVIVTALGKTPEEAEGMADISKYEHGKNLGNTLAKEFDERVGPLGREYDDLNHRYSSLELTPSIAGKADEMAAAQEKALAHLNKVTKAAVKAQASGDPGAAIEAATKVQEAQDALKSIRTQASAPGTTDTIAEKVASLAQREGWTASPSSDIMREVNRVMKELPAQKTLRDLGNYIKAVGANMQSDPLNGAMNRAGGMIKSILREAEADIIGKQIGSEEGAEALSRYQAVRKSYAEASQLKDALDSRLHLKGSTSGYAKALREAAQTDGEAVLRKLSGSGDADLLKVLEEHFPNTADALRKYHIDNVLKTAVDKAKEGETISVSQLRKSLAGMQPELKRFAIPGDALVKTDAVGAILDKLNSLPYNHSNTARTIDKLFEYLPGSTIGLATMLTGHNPATALLVGALAKVLSKDAPDAIKLGMLKFMGSSEPVQAEGFKAMVDYMEHAIKGERLATKAAKNVFKAGSEVLAEIHAPTDAERTRINKSIERYQEQPEKMLNVAGSTGHYLPEHATAVGQTAGNAVAYLSALKPDTAPKRPLDTKLPANSFQKAAYNGALDIAQQPLLVLNKIKQGTVTAQDVQHMKALYPSLYNKMSQKLTNEMTTKISKGEAIPYKTRMGLSLFLSQPLDGTMTPEAIMAAQPKPAGAIPDSPTQPASRPKHSMASLNKLPGMYQTPAQRADSRRIGK